MFAMEGQSFMIQEQDGQWIKYVPRKLLNWGGENKVYLCVRNSNEKAEFAVKQLKLEPFNEELDSALWNLEFWNKRLPQLKSLKNMNHDNIIKYFFIQLTSPTENYIVMEYCKFDTLARQLRQHAFTATESVKFSNDIIKGIQYLHHEQRIALLTVDPGNIYFFGEGEEHCNWIAKIGGCDKQFPVGQFVAVNDLHQANYLYQPPEAFKEPQLIAKEANIWNFGVVMLKMLLQSESDILKFCHPTDDSMAPVVEGDPYYRFAYAAQRGSLPFIPAYIPSEIGVMLRQCFTRDLICRPDSRDLCGTLSKLELKDKERDLHDVTYETTELLDNGAQGEVHKAIRTEEKATEQNDREVSELQKITITLQLQHTDVKEYVALKVCKLPVNHNHEQDGDNFDKKFATYAKLRHPHVIQHLYSQFIDRANLRDCPKYHIVMEYCEGGTLKEACKGGASVFNIQRLTRQLLLGLEYLHSQMIVHRDIKGNNIMLTSKNLEDCCVKIGDFGEMTTLVGTLTGSCGVSQGHGTPGYISPEMIAGTDRIGRKSDIWSLGCVVIEMLRRGKSPEFVKIVDGSRKVLNETASICFVANGGLPLIPDCHPLIARFIKRCLQKEPTKRLTAANLLEDPFMMLSNAEIRTSEHRDDRKFLDRVKKMFL